MTHEQQLELGLTHHRQGRLREAEQIYREVLSEQPDHPDALHLLGVVLGKADQPQRAVELIGRAIALRPDAPDYRANLGIFLRNTGRIDQSIASFRHAIALKTDDAAFHNGLGVTFAKSRQIDLAITEFHTAIRLSSDFSEAHNNLGQALAEMDRLDEAIAAFQQALALQPNDASASNNLGIALQKLRRPDDALAAFRSAVALKPGHTEYLNNLASMLREMGQYDEAAAVYRQMTNLEPGNVDYLYNRGLALEESGRPEDALAIYRQVLTLRPDHPEAHMSSGIVLLLLGDLPAGWKEYEWRSKCPHVPMQRNFTRPQWNGDPLEAKTILLHAEQGFGDTFQFIRYAPLVAKRGGTVIVECPAELAAVLSGVEGIARIITQGDTRPSFDVQSSIMSLPLIFGTTLETIPAEPYLSAPPDRIAAWRKRLENPDGRRRVGMVWAGRPVQQNDRRRSMRLDQFAPLAEVKSARFYSLQKGIPASQAASPPPGMNFEDCGPELHDFIETAALIANLDLVIGVDTSVTHLAGAMGKPVWLLVSHGSDWRWMLNRTDNPWYPTMRLFRQPSPGDWTSAMANVTRAILETGNDPR